LKTSEQMGRQMRGYFAVGVEGGNKIGNLGNLMRTAHGFGASFVFTIGGEHFSHRRSDTSRVEENVPLYRFDTLEEVLLPDRCQIVGVELVDEAIDLPSFTHPHQAAYIMGPERGSLSEAAMARCDHLIKIPTSFCLNQATAGAVVMYDRVRTLGRWPVRPVTPMGSPEPLPVHVSGGQFSRKGKKNPVQ
jgi:tRNA G18 (ribose-2'-O)-methylase SpoU